MAVYSYAQLEALWIQAGGPRALAPVAAAIAEAESGGNSDARNPSGASGLWQILGDPFPGNPFDPATNARMAVAKWRQAPGGGDNFSPWVTYETGAYKAYVNAGSSPDPNVPGSPTAAASLASAGGNPQACAWQVGWGGIPGTSWLQDIFGSGGNVGSGSVCLASKTQVRAVFGGLMVFTGGLLVVAGLGFVAVYGLGREGARVLIAPVMAVTGAGRNLPRSTAPGEQLAPG